MKENMARRIIGNALLYLLLMFVFLLRTCYAIIYMTMSIFIIVPLAVLTNMIRNRGALCDSVEKAIETCIDEIKDIYKWYFGNP